MRFVWLGVACLVVAGVSVWQPWREQPVALPTTCPALAGLPESVGTSSALDDSGVREQVQCAWGHGELPPLIARFQVSRGDDQDAHVTADGGLTFLVARRANVDLRMEHRGTAGQSQAQADVSAWAVVLLDQLRPA